MIFPMIQRAKNDRSVQRALPVYNNEMTKVENLIRSWVVSVLSQYGPASFHGVPEVTTALQHQRVTVTLT